MPQGFNWRPRRLRLAHRVGNRRGTDPRPRPFPRQLSVVEWTRGIESLHPHYPTVWIAIAARTRGLRPLASSSPTSVSGEISNPLAKQDRPRAPATLRTIGPTSRLRCLDPFGTEPGVVAEIEVDMAAQRPTHFHDGPAAACGGIALIEAFPREQSATAGMMIERRGER